MLGEVSAAAFAALLGKQCELVLANGGRVVALEVLEVEERPTARMRRAPAESRMPFSVILRGAANDGFASETCTVRAEGFETLESVYVSRILGDDPDRERAYYQIAFN